MLKILGITAIALAAIPLAAGLHTATASDARAGAVTAEEHHRKATSVAMFDPKASVSYTTNAVRHVTVRSCRSYEELVALFEKEIGHWDQSEANRLVAASAPWDTVRTKIEAMAGKQGLMIFTRINQGEIASLSGRPVSSSLYLVGNAVIATEILKLDIRGGMLVPFRVELDDDRGTGVMSYDLPSSFLGDLGSPALSEIGKSLDLKMGAVADSVISQCPR